VDNAPQKDGHEGGKPRPPGNPKLHSTVPVYDQRFTEASKFHLLNINPSFVFPV